MGTPEPTPRTAADVLADWLYEALDVEFDDANRAAFYELTGKIEAAADAGLREALKAIRDDEPPTGMALGPNGWPSYLRLQKIADAALAAYEKES